MSSRPFAVEVGQQQRQRMRVAHQFERAQRAVHVLVVGDAAADHEAVVELGDLAVVARPRQVQVAVAVHVRQGDRVEHVPGPEALRTREGARPGPVCGGAEPQARRVAGVGQDQVLPPVTVEVDDVDRARVVGGQFPAREGEPAAIPQDAARSVQVGQDDVDVAVVVQVAQTERRADPGEDRPPLRRNYGGVRQGMGDERPAALRSRGYRPRPVGHLRLRRQRNGIYRADQGGCPWNSRPDPESREQPGVAPRAASKPGPIAAQVQPEARHGAH